MKLKNLIILGIILIGLVTAIFLKKAAAPEIPIKEELYDMIQAPLNLETISSCEVILTRVSGAGEKDKTELKFKKEGDNWVIANVYNARADEKRFSEFIEKLDNLKGEFRSDKPELFEDYGITDADSLLIIVRGETGDELARLMVGTKKPDWAHNFVRKANSSSVYITEDNFLALFGFWDRVEPEKFDKKRWLNTDIINFDPDEVAFINISEQMGDREKETSLDLTREFSGGEKKWKTADDYSFGLDQDKIKEYLGSIKNIKASEVVDPEEPGHFDSRPRRLTIGKNNGEQIVVTRGRKQENGNGGYVKVAGEKYDFLVPGSVFNSLEKNTADFFAKNIFELKEENIKELNINDIEKRKKYTAIKSREKGLWKTKKGALIDKTKIEDVIQSIDSIKVKMVTDGEVPKKNILTYIVTKTDGRIWNLEISEEITIAGKQYHLLKIEGDPQKYYIESNNIEVLRAILARLNISARPPDNKV